MENPHPPRLDPERISVRHSFLLKRAEAHLVLHKENRHLIDASIAAAMFRDASATAILLGDYEQAAKLLVRAGKLWVHRGLFNGYALIRLGNEVYWRERLLKDLPEIEKAIIFSAPQLQATDFVRRPNSYRAYQDGSARSVSQLVSLYQSIQLSRTEDRAFESLHTIIRKKLESLPATLLLENLPLARYLDLIDTPPGNFTDSQRESILHIILNRKIGLEMASSDTYHWKRVVNPSKIVNFDMLALCLRAVESGNTDVYSQLFREKDGLLSLPLHAATGLNAHRREKGNRPELGK